MDKKEVITLSSDDESDFTRIEKKNPETNPSKGRKGLENFEQLCLNRYKELTINKNGGFLVESKKQRLQILECSKFQKKPMVTPQNVPEIVDLEECSEKPHENEKVKVNCTNGNSKDDQNHSSPKVIDIDEASNTPVVEEIQTEPSTEKQNPNSLTNHIEKVKENCSEDVINAEDLKPGKECLIETHKNEGSDQNLKFFTEFVEFSGSLEIDPNDRAKLTKKLMKRYGEADCKYIKSPEFKNLIQKCKAKVNKNNLYLIAKEITEELTFRKKVVPNSDKPSVVEEKGQIPPETVKETEIIEEKTNNKQSKKRTRVINKILKKLDKLGCKIRELEEKEVDLNDEEESTYLQLQRYRDRFCQIYTKLCKYTNEIPDADRVCNRKICFTESKYPAINRCIENWLNKTKRFPDFLDIVKLLESQSSSLGLSSNKESIRTIATEIFQQVGAMLKRRRKYDLWDSFCGFLDEGEDPAEKDPLLDKILRNNFDARVKKEQEIFQRYVELQEKERLEPEEVPDEEANRSPVDSGNEDDKEIEEIEDSMNKRVDDEIKKDTQEEIDGNTVQNLEGYPAKESKNNYRNCKSLKWRLENGTKGKSGNVNTEDTEKEKHPEEESKPEEKDSDVEMMNEDEGTTQTVAKLYVDSALKRKHEEEDPIPNKKMKNKENDEDVDIFEIEDESEPIAEEKNEVFEIRCCQIYTTNAFEDWESEKKAEDWEKRKVFRDLTNVNRLMGLHGRKKKNSGLYSPYFLHQSFFEYDKPSWRKRFKLNFRVSPKGQKCTLNREEKEQMGNMESGGDRDEREKDVRNNSDGEETQEGGDSVSGSGNGSEEDNNGDEKKEKGRTDEENENEDEEEEEEETEKDDNKSETDANEHSFPNEKTEEDPNPTEDPGTCENEGGTTRVEPNETKTKHDQGDEEKWEGTKPSKGEETKVDVIKGDSNSIEIDLTDKELDVDVDSRNIKEKDSTPEETVDKRNVDVKETDSKVEETDLTVIERDLDVGQTNVNETDLNVETKETDSSTEERDLTGKETDSNAEERDLTGKETDSNAEERDLTGKETDSAAAESDLDVTKSSVNVKETESDVEITDLAVKDANMIPELDVQGGNLDCNETKVETTDVPNGELEVTEEAPKNGATENEDLMEVGKSSIILGNPGRIRVKGDLEKIEDKGKKKVSNHYIVNVESDMDFGRRKETIPRERKRRATTESTPLDYSKILECQQMARRTTSSTSDEERVKRFLLHSPSSISITPPRTLTLPKPPSQAALQALATLRNLKGISATIVRGGKPKSEDDVVIVGGSQRGGKRTARELPVISNVQSIGMTTPKIVTVQGNVSGIFENPWAQVPNNGNQGSSIRISNVWGGLPNNFMQEGEVAPGCSSRQNDPRPENSLKKKRGKKTVEYVVLD